MTAVRTLDESVTRSTAHPPSLNASSAPEGAPKNGTMVIHQQDSLSVKPRPPVASAREAVQKLISTHESAVDRCNKAIESAIAGGVRLPSKGVALFLASIGASVGAAFIPIAGWAAAVVAVSLGFSYLSYRAIRAFVCRHGQIAMARKQKEHHEAILERLRADGVDDKTKLQEVLQMEHNRALHERRAADTEMTRAERSNTASTVSMVVMAACFIASFMIPGVGGVVASALGSCSLVGGYTAGGFAKGAHDDHAAYLDEERLASEAAAIAERGLRAPVPSRTMADAISAGS